MFQEIPDPIQIGREWHFEDGSILPVVSGGSDLPPAIPVAEADPVQPEVVDNPDETIGNVFLKNVDPADRPVLEKYIKPWDQQVNERFRSIHKEYEPYKNIGLEPDDLAAAAQVFQFMQQDPQGFYELYTKELGLNVAADDTTQVNQEVAGTEEMDDLPPAVASRLSKLEQMLQGVTQFVTEQQQERKATEENRALESMMTDLKSKHGEFDQDLVLVRLSRGMKPDAAVKDAQKYVGELVAKQQAATRRPVPPFLGGAGAVPNGADVTKMTNKQAQSTFADMLANRGE